MPLKDKEARAKYAKEYREKNKEKISQWNKLWREKNKENKKEYMKEYYDKNKEARAKYRKEYDEKNKEEIKQYQKSYREKHKEEKINYQKQYYNENKEHLKQQAKDYSEKNKEKIKEYNRTNYRKKHSRFHHWKVTNVKYWETYEKLHDRYINTTHCELCNKEFPEKYENNYNRKVVEHDHLSGYVRSICCQACNMKLAKVDNKRKDVLLEIHRKHYRFQL